MSDRKSNPVTHHIIMNDDHQFVVWSHARKVPAGWRMVGREGTREELELYLQQMAVETMPAPLLITDRRTLDTHFD